MKLIVDSGSTKADWVCLDKQQVVQSVTTLGLNPEVVSEQEFVKRMNSTSFLSDNKQNITQVFFYGAGCGSMRTKKVVEGILSNYFVNSRDNQVYEDTYAAVYASLQKNQKGIVCIHGTGSNASFYNGTHIEPLVISLGYMAMDDCSGSSFGRLLLKNYFLNLMPQDLAVAFENKYHLDADQVKYNFYKKQNPNAYMASFLPFLIENKNHVYFQEMIVKEISYFVQAYLKDFPQKYNCPVHLVGSVSYLLQQEFTTVLEQFEIQVGGFIQKPLDGLIEFHKN